MGVEKSTDWWDSVEAMQKVIGHYPSLISALIWSNQDYDIFVYFVQDFSNCVQYWFYDIYAIMDWNYTEYQITHNYINDAS